MDEILIQSIINKSMKDDAISGDSRSSNSSSPADFPNSSLRDDLPGSRCDLPGSRCDFPGSRCDLRGSREDVYGSRNSMYSSSSSIHVPKSTIQTQTDVSWEDLTQANGEHDTPVASSPSNKPCTSTPRRRRRRPKLPDFAEMEKKEKHEEETPGQNGVAAAGGEQMENIVEEPNCDMGEHTNNEQTELEEDVTIEQTVLEEDVVGDTVVVEKDQVDNAQHMEQEATAGESSQGAMLYSPQLMFEIVGVDYNMPTSLDFFSNGGIVVAEYGNSHLQLFAEDGQYLASYNDVKPFGVCVDNEDRVLVADRRDKTLKIIDQQGEFITEWEHEKFKWISGVAVTNDWKYVICEREKCKIGIYEPDGQLIKEFGSNGNNDTQINMADFLTVDSHNRILICDSCNHCVKAFDTNGKFLAKYGRRSNREGELEWPKGVCLDDRDNILVTDTRNKRVAMFSPDGEFIDHLIVDYPHPFGIAFSAGDPNLIGLTRYSLKGQSMISIFRANAEEEED